MSATSDEPHRADYVDERALLKEEAKRREGDEIGWVMQNIKAISLGLLVLQNSAQFLLTGYSRRANLDGSPLYLVSVAVLLAEMGKGLLCAVVIMLTEGGVDGLVEAVRDDIIGKPMETLKVGVPAFCYTLQNNLLFVALSNLPPAVCQVLYQTKTLSTAFWSIAILGKEIGGPQWAALVLLVVGVVLVQWKDSSTTSLGADANPMLGLIAVACCSLLSGFAGVFLERMLKGTKTTLWVRNIQLCMFSVPLQLLAIVHQDFAAVSERGLLGGFSAMPWSVVLINTGGGLLVAVVIKYADNILKTFATVLAIVCSCFVSMMIAAFDFKPSPIFFAGVTVVFASIFLYSWTPSRPLLSYIRGGYAV
ncbi:nucleotide-sugar transporter-domain-containing protein [Pavlovales sp. CCMP2436]|nr:nucleotide-sugar transporter-domain-containing protein [Pavlovales sp. CCMP2436]